MAVSAEAKRIMVVALGKLYSSRTQRGGLRLHRSLLLTMVMRSARDIYHAAQATEASPTGGDRCSESEDTPTATATPTPTRREPRPPCEDKENVGGPLSLDRHSRKRRGKEAAEPDFLPCKKAKMEGKGLQRLNNHNNTLRSSVNCGVVRSVPVPVSCAVVAF